MKPKFNESSRQYEPIVSLSLKFKQRGKGYLQFAAALILTGATLTYITINQSSPARWLSAESIFLAVLFCLPGILFLMVGLHYFTRQTEIVLYRDQVRTGTKTFFMWKPRIKSYPMKEFNGITAACEKGKKITLNYVMLRHPDLSRSVVVGREFPTMEAAKKRRDELARLLKIPVLEQEGDDKIAL